MVKILVVEDAEFTRKRVVKSLRAEGYDIYEAANGLEALEAYCSCRPDIVIMDVTMPVLDGLKALEKIKAIDSEACIILLPRLGQERIIVDALEAGATDYLVKPFDIDRLCALIEKTMEQESNSGRVFSI